jgi:hypothetical protein
VTIAVGAVSMFALLHSKVKPARLIGLGAVLGWVVHG